MEDAVHSHERTAGNVLYIVYSTHSLPCSIALPLTPICFLHGATSSKTPGLRQPMHVSQCASMDAIKHGLPSEETPAESNQGFQSQ